MGVGELVLDVAQAHAAPMVPVPLRRVAVITHPRGRFFRAAFAAHHSPTSCAVSEFFAIFFFLLFCDFEAYDLVIVLDIPNSAMVL